MSAPATSTAAADRILLFGILGVQGTFFSRDVLNKALGDWANQKTKSLGQIFQERGDLSAQRLAALEAIVDDYLKTHGDDPQHDVATLPPSVVEEIRRIAKAHVGIGVDSQGATGTFAQAPPMRAAHSAAVPEDEYALGAAGSAPRYRILHSHARGGLGEVFVAADEEVRREVALKQIQEQYADHPESRTRFVREAEITGGLEHPGVVPVYGLGQYADGRPFYAMRFIRGDSFKDAIERFHQGDTGQRDAGAQTLELRQLLNRFIAVCNTMAYAHSRGVLHRDLKPANVMLGSYGETLVVDWGLAKQFERTEAERSSGESTLPPASSSGPEGATQAGQALGTPAYMSPEQAAGRWDVLGPASDIYSLGAMLYTLLTGRPPFQDPVPALVLMQVIQGEFLPPRQVKRDLPRALEAVCLKAMARQPADRYESARALADDVEHWLADEPVSARRESIWERTKRMCRHRPLYAAGMGFIVAMDLLIGAVIIAVLLMQGSQLASAALAFLPFTLLGAMIGIAIVVLFLGQLWWLAGAGAGAILGSRGALMGCLIGLVTGGLLWPPLRATRLHPAAFDSHAWLLLPLVGAVLGAVLAAFGTAWWTRAKSRILLGALIGGALGEIGGGLAVAAIDSAHASSQLEDSLVGMLVAATAGALLGTIIGAFPGNARKATLGMATGALVGASGGVALALDTTNGMFRLLAFSLGGGLAGGALGVLIAVCRGEAAKRALRSALVGGKLGLAGGTILLALVLWIGTLIGPMASVLTWLALPVILLPPVVEIAFGLMNRARRQTLLTRATRGAVIGTVLGGTVTLTLSMAALFSQFPNVAGTANVPSTTAPKLGPLADLSKAAMKPGDDPFQALVTGQEKLVHENPNNNELAVVLGSFYKTQATLAREQGNSEKAVAVYDKAIATLQAAVQKEPRHSKAREELRNCHSGRAETLARLDRSAEALAEWDRALALDTWPDRSEYRLQRALTLARLGEYAKAMTDCDDLARGKDLPAATLYTLGRAYARAAGAIPDQGARAAAADRAMALLKQAVAAGYNAALIKQEKDLDALRDRDDFKELVAALEVRKAKEKK